MNFLDPRLPDRFWQKVTPCPISGCWLWTAYCDPQGYGHIGIGSNKHVRAHRLAFEALVTPIPAGLSIDHKCRVTSCVNPQHLEPVTARENNLRGNGWSGRNARKTECPQGHPLIAGNIRATLIGRQCKECHRIREAARKARKREGN